MLCTDIWSGLDTLHLYKQILPLPQLSFNAGMCFKHAKCDLACSSDTTLKQSEKGLSSSAN